jgi:hypothetical protein
MFANSGAERTNNVMVDIHLKSVSITFDATHEDFGLEWDMVCEMVKRIHLNEAEKIEA